jgi:hypothetical protein
MKNRLKNRAYFAGWHYAIASKKRSKNLWIVKTRGGGKRQENRGGKMGCPGNFK